MPLAISIIVPCKNERKHIRPLLESICTQQLDPAWRMEVIIADGQSSDGTREILTEYAASMSNLKIVDNPAGIVSTGLNAALAVSSGDIVIRMDAHTTYAPDYVRECVSILQETGADNVGGPWIARGAGLWGSAIAAAFRSRFCCGGGRAHDPNYEGEVDTVYLGCWPRGVFDRVGMFDPALVRNQDDEFNFRLKSAGGKLWQSPRIRSCYVARSSLKLLFRQYLQYGFWKVAVIKKHGKPASWRHLLPAMFVGSLIAFPLCIAIAAAMGLRSTAGLLTAAFDLEVIAYLGSSLWSALSFWRSERLATVLALPVVFAAYQISYGIGFLLGMVQAMKPESDVSKSNAAFTALTR